MGRFISASRNSRSQEGKTMHGKLLPLCLLISGFTAGYTSYGSKSLHETLELSRDQRIVINLPLGDEINIFPVQGHTLEFSGEIEVNGGENDDAYRVELSLTESTVDLKSRLDESNDLYRVVQHLDEDGNALWSERNVEIKARFDVYVPMGYPVTVKTINATLNLEDLHAPLIAETINGEIYLRLRKDSNIDLSVSTIQGDCLTDLAFTSLAEHEWRLGPGENRVAYRLNRGGMSVRLKSINGWMYVTEKAD